MDHASTEPREFTATNPYQLRVPALTNGDGTAGVYFNSQTDLFLFNEYCALESLVQGESMEDIGDPLPQSFHNLIGQNRGIRTIGVRGRFGHIEDPLITYPLGRLHALATFTDLQRIYLEHVLILRRSEYEENLAGREQAEDIVRRNFLYGIARHVRGTSHTIAPPEVLFLSADEFDLIVERGDGTHPPNPSDLFPSGTGSNKANKSNIRGEKSRISYCLRRGNVGVSVTRK